MQPNPSEHPHAGDTHHPRGGENSFGGAIAGVLVAFFVVLALGGIATGVIGSREIAAPEAAPAHVMQVAPTPAPTPQPSPTVPAPTPTP